jgi:choline transport protein
LKTGAAVSFGVVIAASWAATANGFQAGLYNGGPAALVWGFLVAGPGTLAMVYSLAEMAAITPTVGAQYRWTAIYSPEFLPRKFFSFLQGYQTVFAWMCSATLLPYFTGSQITGLLILNYPDSYVYHGWHCTLIGYATIAGVLLFNVFARRFIRMIEVLGKLASC